MAFLDDPYQFLPQPPDYEYLEFQGDFLEAILGVAEPPIRSKTYIENLLTANQSAVGEATPYNGINCVIYAHAPVTRRVVINGVRTTIQDYTVSLYTPSESGGQDVIVPVTTYLSSLP